MIDKAEILEAIKDARQQIQQMRAYHLRASLTELELWFDPAALAASMLTDQFGRIIRDHTLQLAKKFGRAIQADPELNAKMEQVERDMAETIDGIGHKIFKRHFNEAFDRVDETLKAAHVQIQCLCNDSDS